MLSFKTLGLITCGLSIVLAILLLFFPAVIFMLFGITGNEAAYFISRRAAMLFIGYAVIACLSRNAQPSEGRQAITLGIACSMSGLAILGLFEFVRGFVGSGIFLAVSAELFLAVSYFTLWQSDRKAGA